MRDLPPLYRAILQALVEEVLVLATENRGKQDLPGSPPGVPRQARAPHDAARVH